MNTGLYGVPPEELGLGDAAATQYSPLMPGAAALESVDPASLDAMTMLAPAGTIERRYATALALRALAPGADFTLLAPKDKGGSRLAGELAHFGCETEETAKRHHRICRCPRPETVAGIEIAVAEGSPQRVDALGLWSQPGVFSWDRIDPGSALLADHLPVLAGRGADFGCGIGLLAKAALQSTKVQELTLIDIDRRAIDAAKRNIDDARAHFLWADFSARGADLEGLDFVVMNPPFHGAGREDHGLGQRFIQRAAGALRRGGTLWLVANRHLPYEKGMEPLFRHITRRADEAGFKIYEAQK